MHGMVFLIRSGSPLRIVTCQTLIKPSSPACTMVAELNKQDSTVSSLSIPEAFAGMLGTYRLEESERFEEFMQALGVSPFMLLSDGVRTFSYRIGFPLVQLLIWFEFEGDASCDSCELCGSAGPVQARDEDRPQED